MAAEEPEDIKRATLMSKTADRWFIKLHPTPIGSVTIPVLNCSPAFCRVEVREADADGAIRIAIQRGTGDIIWVEVAVSQIANAIKTILKEKGEL